MEPAAEIERVGKAVLDAAFKVHTVLGPGLLESVYEAALACEMVRRGFMAERQKAIPAIYEGIRLDVGFRADLVVNGCVLVELKAVEQMQPVFQKTTTTYLRLSGLKLGFLINFNAAHLRDGITRIVNGLAEPPSFRPRPLVKGAQLLQRGFRRS